MSNYLLRFDDISPYMNWSIWDQIEKILDAHGVKPIVAIVPDCQDPKIMPSSPNELFWQRVLEWQAKGWSIALHGYSHVLVENKGESLVNLSKSTEFSGLSYKEQDQKIRAGLKIFNSYGVETCIWVAPAHSFDAITLQVLSEHNFKIVSDGLFLSPYRDTNGLLWIPQQLWRFRQTPFGIWTICYHHNTWRTPDLEKFEKNIMKFKNKITSVDKITSQYKNRTASLAQLIQKFVIRKMLIIRQLSRSLKKQGP